MLVFATSSDTAVNNALDLIEADLKIAVVTATERLNAVLAGNPPDTRALHNHLSDLHRMAAQIDENTARRQRDSR